MSFMTDILSLDFDELRSFIKNDLAEPEYRAKQISAWLILGKGFAEMTNLPALLRDKLSEKATLFYPVIKKKLISKIDGTVKYLFGLSDGNCIESVLMEYEHGTTICISSQVGCRMGCKFCASTLCGLTRSLEVSELLGQVISAQRDSGKRISNIVMMGIGEPLDNYDRVVKFIKVVSSPFSLNIGQRHISLSTSGLADKIKSLADENLQITLSVSLHAYDDETRSSIMPVNNKWCIDMLLSACRYYFDRTGRRISFEYTLINGKNDTAEGARKLALLLKKQLGAQPFHVNLIPVNEVTETKFKKSGREAVDLFRLTLERNGVNATVRRKLGEDINAACGQLRANDLNERNKALKAEAGNNTGN